MKGRGGGGGGGTKAKRRGEKPVGAKVLSSRDIVLRVYNVSNYDLRYYNINRM